jgi:uncharacterized circularly permuted ATP-grasp superfamily protein/uncharacterized alpha-E superfamily protein
VTPPGTMDIARPVEAYDEFVTGGRAIRAHWQGLLSVLRALPGGGFGDRVERARRQIQESGAMRRDAPDGSTEAAWSFEPLPLILTTEDWSVLERGLRQRARLLDALLGDLYGPQRLLKERVLPPALVHGNAHYLRPCRTPTPLARRHLLVYAADVVRLPDGSWAVLADHTQAPSGAGYALFLRHTLARAVPEAFRATPVREIGSFFDAWQIALRNQAPADTARPNIALLTAGLYAQTYFEQVYLARRLGIAMVEGGDLSVRSGNVAIKTLEGLRTVDVLLRRLDSAYCDPLELLPDSSLGVSGLLEVARQGKIAVANALGSGAAEIPALAPYLPAAARLLLGAELELPSTDCRWLGEPDALQHALPQLDRLVLRPALTAGREPLTGADVVQRVQANPRDFVAHEHIMVSRAPCWTASGLHPAPIVARLFLVAQGDDYLVMPGGVVHSPREPIIGRPGRLEGALRALWVLAEDSDELVVPPPTQFQRIPITRGGDLQSRGADNLFWLGRYVERLDNAARLLRAALSRRTVGPLGPREMIELRHLGIALDATSLVRHDDALAPPDSAIFLGALVRAMGPGRVFHHSLLGIKRLTAAARDRLSNDMLATLEELLGEVGRGLETEPDDIERLRTVLDGIIRFVATVSGFAQENVTRGSRWNFLDLGRRIERAQFTCRGALSPFQQAPIVWDAAMRLTLELCDSALTYRARYLDALEPAPVLDLVLLDDTNPRSLAFQLLAVDQHLIALGRITGVEIASPSARAMADLTSAVAMFEADERAWRDDGLTLTLLRQSLDDTTRAVTHLSDEVTRAFFSLLPAARRLGVTVA